MQAQNTQFGEFLEQQADAHQKKAASPKKAQAPDASDGQVSVLFALWDIAYSTSDSTVEGFTVDTETRTRMRTVPCMPMTTRCPSFGKDNKLEI